MTKLVGGVWGLTISLVLFGGFNMVNLLASDDALQYVGVSIVTFCKANKFWLYGALACLFTLQQTWLRWPKPVSLAEVEAMRGLVQALLEATLAEYYARIAAKGSRELPSVRVNIMLPTWRRFRCGQYLKIYYTYGGPVGVLYPDEERDLRWGRGQGTCGYAWGRGHTAIYDSAEARYKTAETRLNRRQQQLVGYIRSVLSIPIWSKTQKQVIGVLSFDSRWNVERTFLHTQEIVQLLEARARIFSHVLFADGVQSH